MKRTGPMITLLHFGCPATQATSSLTVVPKLIANGAAKGVRVPLVAIAPVAAGTALTMVMLAIARATILVK